MLTSYKLKWLGSITLSSVILVMALLGGDWGTNYTANASVNANPIIYLVQPSKVPARSPDRVIIISGLNFGTTADTGVRLTGDGFDNILYPITVEPNALSVTVEDIYLTVPTAYTLTVVISGRPEGHTLPELPLWPFDLQSNPLSFSVFQAEEYFLPIIKR
jgi:hypothetical protein